MTQLALPTAPHNRTDTSRAAAESIRQHISHLESVVLDALWLSDDGATCDEIEDATNMAHQTCSARINQLLKKGEIVDTGNRRPTRSGRMARVYKKARVA